MAKTFEQCLPVGSYVTHDIFAAKIFLVVHYGEFSRQLSFPDDARHPEILESAHQVWRELVTLSKTTDLLERP